MKRRNTQPAEACKIEKGKEAERGGMPFRDPFRSGRRAPAGARMDSLPPDSPAGNNDAIRAQVPV